MNSASEELINLAEKICSAGLREPALFFLEAHRPLSGVFAHLGHFIAPLFPGQRTFMELFSDPSQLELLTNLLEEKR